MPQFFDVSAATEKTVTRKRVMARGGIVLHSTEGVNSLEWLQGGSARAGRPASADYLISRAGDCFQLTQRGWHSYHVGVARWRKMENVGHILNELLIGIELESNSASYPRYTNEQLIVCAALCRRLMMQYWFSVFNIVYHGDIALPLGRRSDPVSFPAYIWTKELLQPSKLWDSFVWPEVLS